ncbi:MAG: hypothetical protein JOY84_11825 [Curvibacter sp.]|nr:hypothetical protein [Curvibacter sp.]
MFALIARLLQNLMARGPEQDASAGIPNGLFETAEARAGTDPVQAQELRCAASAYLRVVR